MIATNEHRGRSERLYEAVTFPGAEQELEYMNDIQELLMDSSYRVLDTAEIDSLLFRYDNDPGIRTATHIHNSSIFSGGVTFQKKDGSKLDDAARKWYDTTWSRWGLKLLRHRDAIGWCATACQRHPKYVGVPVVLELSKMTIFYKTTTDGSSHFYFLENIGSTDSISRFIEMRKHDIATSGACGQSSYLYRYIPNVVVFIDTPPFPNGCINSKVVVLAADLDMDEFLTDTTRAAIAARANPMIMLERVQDKFDPEAVVSSIQPTSMMLGNGSVPYENRDDSMFTESTAITGMSNGAQKEYEQKRFEYSKALAMMGSNGMQNAAQLAKDHIRAIAHQSQKEYYIGEGKRYVSSTVAEAPSDLLLAFRQARIERIFNVLGIPYSMVSQNSSTGGKTSMNENAMTVFVNTQKEAKQQLITYIGFMYDRIYYRFHALHDIVDTPIEQLDLKGIKHHGVSIIMSGLPQDDVVSQMYMVGALKYEAYVKFMAAKHSIPLEDFNQTALVSLDDLNGIKPDSEAPAAKKTRT